MSDRELIYFEILKKEVVKTLQKSYVVNSDIKKWKGQDITFLQDDLSDKVNGRISEKWFYTHIKANTGKLPRIDMLNILSKYTGYQNWNDLKDKSPEIKKENSKNRNNKILILLLVSLFIGGASIGFHFYKKKSIYKFCFIFVE